MAPYGSPSAHVASAKILTGSFFGQHNYVCHAAIPSTSAIHANTGFFIPSQPLRSLLNSMRRPPGTALTYSGGSTTVSWSHNTIISYNPWLTGCLIAQGIFSTLVVVTAPSCSSHSEKAGRWLGTSRHLNSLARQINVVSL